MIPTIADIVMPMYNLIEYSKNYAKSLKSLWQYQMDNPNDNIRDSESLKFKARITGRTPVASSTNDVELAVPWKKLSNSWRNFKMILKN